MKYKKNTYKEKELSAYRRGRNMGLVIGLVGTIIIGIVETTIINRLLFSILGAMSL